MKIELQDNEEFWEKIEEIVLHSEIVVDRAKGSCHPIIKDIIYPVDYGYLKNTKSMDGEGIDIWIGKDEKAIVNGILCTIDTFRKDSEIKILFRCSCEEIKSIYSFTNERQEMKGILLFRNYDGSHLWK